jgi:hypothetical protein
MAAKAAFSFRAEHIWLSRPINGDPHEMSRGLGQIEQEILALIEDEGEERPYSAEELATAIYRPNAGDDDRCTRAQKVAVIRAMHSLLRKLPDRVNSPAGRAARRCAFRASRPMIARRIESMFRPSSGNCGRRR